MYELNEEVSARFLDKKKKYESMSQAIKIVKKEQDGVATLSTKGIDNLIDAKYKAKKEYLEEVNDIVASHFDNSMGMIIKTDIIAMGEGWYGIAYRTDKRLELKIEPLLEKDALLLERTSSNQHYQRAELESIIPAYLNEVGLYMYVKYLEKRAIEFIHDYIPMFEIEYDEPEKEEVEVVVAKPSSHAAKRWVQRMMHIHGEVEAEDYRRSHLVEVDEAIAESFKTAVLIWEGADDVKYWFNDNNVMFLTGRDNTIITLYEEDFGFSKDINRSIVTMQIEEVKRAYGSLDAIEEECSKVIGAIDQELLGIQGEIDELLAKISYLNAHKLTLSSTKDENIKRAKLEREHFNNQFNKLFKKWEV